MKRYYDKYLTLVNKENKIDDDFEYNLINVYSEYKKSYILVDKEAYINYILLKNKLKKMNIIIDIESAYRTHEYQKKLYDRLVKEKSVEYANKYIAKPYYSEHETGLAIDISILKNNKYYIEHELLNLDELKIIHKVMYKYGFILRYPKNKEHITKYNYEPWHIRYVGKFAKNMYERNLTLEEFLYLYLKK